MQISLSQAEIEVGVKMYIQSRGVQFNDSNILMDFTNTRKGNAGINVDVDLGEDSEFPGGHVPLAGVTRNSYGGISAKRVAVRSTSVDSKTTDTKASATPKEKEPEPQPEPEVKAQPEETGAVTQPAAKEDNKEQAEPVKQQSPESESPQKQEPAPVKSVFGPAIKEEPKKKESEPVNMPFSKMVSDTPNESESQRNFFFS